MNVFFGDRLLQWHSNINDRKMPWKEVKDPYKIWLSEIILQQTRVQQGLKYYEKFIDKFPTVQDLAKAKDETVFKMWEGLGYYNRCKNMLATARTIAKDYSGVFPQTYKEVIALKGIGKYTASAILSFAFNQPYAVVDGNVYRVLSRFFGIQLPIDTNEGVQFFENKAFECLVKNKAGLYNQAIMDLGATVCKPQLAMCNQCPLSKKCSAFQNDTVYELPVKSKKITVRKRNIFYFLLQYNGKIAIRKREKKDVWQNLYEFVLCETDQPMQTNKTTIQTILEKEWAIEEIIGLKVSKVYDQKLTHQHIKVCFVAVKLKAFTKMKDYQWINTPKLDSYPFAAIVNDFFKKEKKGFIFEK